MSEQQKNTVPVHEGQVDYNLIRFSLRCLAGLFSALGVANVGAALADHSFDHSPTEISLRAEALVLEAGTVAVSLGILKAIDRKRNDFAGVQKTVISDTCREISGIVMPAPVE